MANKRILSLTVHNVKGIKDVKLIPGDNSLVIIGGRNGQGKSSLLDSVVYALGGKSALPKKPVREGTDSAQIVLELENLIITRTMTEAADRLVVTSREGVPFKSPQAMLDKLVGLLSFDPLAFSRMGESADGRRKQAQLVRDMAGLDFTDADAERERVFAERTMVNRELKTAEAKLKGMTLHEDVGYDEISVADVARELDEARQHNRVIEVKLEEAEQLRDDIQDMCAKLADMKQRLETSNTTLARLEADIKDQQPTDTASIQTKIDTADEHNQKVRNNAALKDAHDEFRALGNKADKLTDKLTDIDDTKAAAINGAKLPIEGIGFDEDGLTLDGRPFAQASSSEKLRASVAMGLATNPELRIMLIDQGSELDAQSLDELAAMAAEAEAQVWLCRVSEGDECTVIMEAGRIAD